MARLATYFSASPPFLFCDNLLAKLLIKNQLLFRSHAGYREIHAPEKAALNWTFNR
jgi:hypothetical protein